MLQKSNLDKAKVMRVKSCTKNKVILAGDCEPVIRVINCVLLTFQKCQSDDLQRFQEPFKAAIAGSYGPLEAQRARKARRSL